MKLFFVLFLFLISASCRKEIKGTEGLSPAEIDYLRRIGQERCTAQVAPIYALFLRESNKVFITEGFNRGYGFEFILKEEASEERKMHIKVWKQTESEIYFYINQTRPTTDLYFLKISKSDNERMISEMQSIHCNTVNTRIYKFSAGDSGPINFTHTFDRPISPNTDRYVSTYQMNLGYLAYFAQFHQERTITTYNVDGDETGTVRNADSTFEQKNEEFSTVDYRTLNQKFCTVASPARVTEEGIFSLNTCSSTVPADWNLSL